MSQSTHISVRNTVFFLLMSVEHVTKFALIIHCGHAPEVAFVVEFCFYDYMYPCVCVSLSLSMHACKLLNVLLVPNVAPLPLASTFDIELYIKMENSMMDFHVIIISTSIP